MRSAWKSPPSSSGRGPLLYIGRSSFTRSLKPSGLAFNRAEKLNSIKMLDGWVSFAKAKDLPARSLLINVPQRYSQKEKELAILMAPLYISLAILFRLPFVCQATPGDGKEAMLGGIGIFVNCS